MKEIINVGLYGTNGHQIHKHLAQYPGLKLAGCAGGGAEEVGDELLAEHSGAVICETLSELLAVPDLHMVVLCSPRRCDQADDTIQALEAGVAVYAEKPCATTEEALDQILQAVEATGMVFHEMAGTVFSQPYHEMRKRVAEGVLGEVVQVFVQKSYPFHERRPQDEVVDGGLIAQSGVHAVRYIEQVAGVRVDSIDAWETGLGNPQAGSDLKMAASMMARLENGGVASVIANYLNPIGFGSWGNETVRIFGTRGMMEAVDGGTRTRLVLGEEDMGSIEISGSAPDWLTCVIGHIREGRPMPISLEEELHPTRVVLRANVAAKRRGQDQGDSLP